MNKMWLVARKELRMMARTKLYLIATIGGPFVIIMLIALPVLLHVIDSSFEGRSLAFVAAGPLLPMIRAELTPHGIIVEEAAEESNLIRRVHTGDLDGYVVLPVDVFSTEEYRYVSGGTVDLNLSRLVSSAIGRAVVQRRL